MDNRVDDVPAGFKMTELGLLPEDWKLGSIGSYCDVFSGYAFKSKDFVAKGIPVIRISNLQEGSVLLDHDSVFISDKEADQVNQKFVLNSGDVLIAMTGATTGKIAVVPPSLSGSLLNQRVGKIFITNNAEFLAAYGNFVFQTDSVQTAIKSNILQSAQGNISPEKIKQILIAVPPLSEQRAIAYVLSTIQRSIEAQDKVIAAARELKKSLMRHLFTYGPVPVTEIDKVELKETEIGSFPVGWNITSIGDQFYLKQGKSLSAKNDIGTNPIPFLRTANVLWGKIDISTIDQMDFTEEEIAQYRLIANDLLVCEGGDIGRTAIWDNEIDLCCYQNHLHRLRPISQNIVPQYLMYWMHMSIQLLNLYEGEGNKTTIPNLSQSRLKEFRFPLPTVEQQNMIVKTISDMDNKIQAEENRKSALQTLFKTMLHLLMTGKIRVKDLDLIKEH